MCVRKMEWPRRCWSTPEPGPQKGLGTVDTDRVHSHDHDHDTVEAHYASLERLRPHACNDGWVFVGHLVIDDHGKEVEVIEALPCGRCARDR
jgi:hypothetical protein